MVCKLPGKMGWLASSPARPAARKRWGGRAARRALAHFEPLDFNREVGVVRWPRDFFRRGGGGMLDFLGDRDGAGAVFCGFAWRPPLGSCHRGCQARAGPPRGWWTRPRGGGAPEAAVRRPRLGRAGAGFFSTRGAGGGGLSRSYGAPTGLSVFLRGKPRALPWAEECCPVGAPIERTLRRVSY